MGRKEALIKNTAIFAIGNIGSRVLVILILPFCTYYIDPTGMGIYSLIYSLLEVLKPASVLGLPDALFRWLLDKGANRRHILSSWTSMFLVPLAVLSSMRSFGFSSISATPSSSTYSWSLAPST